MKNFSKKIWLRKSHDIRQMLVNNLVLKNAAHYKEYTKYVL